MDHVCWSEMLKIIPVYLQDIASRWLVATVPDTVEMAFLHQHWDLQLEWVVAAAVHYS
jgi:hypothetical protein